MKKPTFGQVAHEVFPKEFSENPKRAADRARQLYRSFEKRFPDAHHPESDLGVSVIGRPTRRENLKMIISQRVNRN